MNFLQKILKFQISQALKGDFIKKDEWPPNSPDLNPLDFQYLGAMLEKYQAYIPKPTNKTELKNRARSNLERLATRAR